MSTSIIEEIKEYLEGYDKQKYIVGVESSYRENKISLIIHDQENGKRIEKHSLKPFLWMKSPPMSLFYNGNTRLVKTKMREYKVKFIPLSTVDANDNEVLRLENGYKFLVTCKGTYGDLINFFKKGGLDPFSDKLIDPSDKNSPEFRNFFLTISPTEQFLIQTGKRLFKGMEEYSDVHRLSFDLETTGLDPHRHRIFQIGIKDNKGFQHVLSVNNEQEDEETLKTLEIDIITKFFLFIDYLKPAIISGYNSENFDWNFIVVRCQKLKIDIKKIALTLGKSSFYRKKRTVKMGPEMEWYEQTHMFGYNIMDVYHAVRRAQAINSSIKKAGLKYITQYSNAAKPNRVYIPGDKIGKTYNDKLNDYWLNDENGEWGVIIDDVVPKNTIKLKGSDIVERYLIDDLWETEKVDDIFNQATYLLSKIIPTSFMRTSTMGTAATWKLLMLGWYYKLGIAIPHTQKTRGFIGGLSRLLEVGFSVGVVKFDFAGLYPSIQLTHDVFTECDVSGAMKGLLTYNYDKRDHYKALKNEYALKGDFIKSSFFDKKQLPLKMLNNGMFGSISAPHVYPWGDTDIGEKITCTGRQYLRHMIRFFISKGFKPLVGDTDGFNYSIPLDINKFIYTSNGVHRFNKKGKTYTGMNAVVGEYNDKYMRGRMGLDIDEICEATINIARKNYADLINGEVKLVGNSIKSKKMPTYISDFIDKGIKLLLNGDGHSFVNEYYETVEKIYNLEIPLSKIANKSRVRISVNDYKKKMKTKNKSGGAMARQAHMELIIKEKLNVDLGDTIHYVNTSTKKSHGDVQRVTKCKYNKKEMDQFFSGNGKYPDDAYTTTIRLNCKLIPKDVLENETEMSIEYNVPRYLDAFNKRVKPLLVCFDYSVRDDLLINTPLDRNYFTKQELQLTSGQPYKESDQDKIEELLTITDEELKFWDKIGVSPTYMFEEYNIQDEFSYDKKTKGSIT